VKVYSWEIGVDWEVSCGLEAGDNWQDEKGGPYSLLAVD